MMWIQSAQSKSETEQRQQTLLEELAERDPRIKRILEKEKVEGIPPAQPLETLPEFGLEPEEVEELGTTELAEELEREGSMAADRLSQMVNEFHHLANQGVPPTLAYLEVSISNKLSILECDVFWETLKGQAENLQSMMDLNASELSKHVRESNKEIVHNIVAKLKVSSPAKTYINYRASKGTAPKVMSSEHAMLPTKEIARLASEALTHLKSLPQISWSDVRDAIAQVENSGKVHALASRMYDCEIDYEDPNHLALYQGVRDSAIFVLQCVLEKSGYEWDPKKSVWIK